MSKKRDPDLNEKYDIRMEYSREEHWRDVPYDGYDKINFDALKLYV